MVTTFKARAWNPETDGNGEFEIPDVPDGTYKAKITDVEDRMFPGFDGGPEQMKYMIDWELDGLEKEDGSAVSLRQFLTVPQGLIDSGYVHEKSRMFAFLKAIGEDPEAPSFDVDPTSWTGREAMIWVKGVRSKKRPDEVRPQIVDVTPVQRATRTGKVGVRTTTTPKAEADY